MTTWTNISGGSAITESLADQAATSATNAANSASAASTSATAAEAAKTAAQASETASAASETASAASEAAAASSETAAAASQAAASSSETAAASSATSAGTSATNAATSASNASTSAANAATSESNAATSASNAATSESNASTSASNASTSATAAAGSATSASNSATAAAADLASFQGQYHGASASEPTTGVDIGDLWFDSVASAMKVFDGSSWVAAYISAAGTLVAANNLSDVSSASASRTNLGLDTMATQAATAVDIDGGSIDGAVIGGSSAAAGTFTTAVVSGTSSSDLVRITQTGAGNALVVEDSTNPDSTPFVVDASGNVGIGTSPSSRLSIQADATSDVDLRIFSDTAYTPRIYLGDTASQTQGAIGYYNSVDALFFQSNGSEAMRVDSARNVGIGTPSPVNLLDVNGGVGVLYSSGLRIVRNTGTTNSAILVHAYSSGDNLQIAPAGNDPASYITLHTASGSVLSERVRIDSSGRVGIGRTPTTNKLEVAGTIESTTGGFKFPDGSTQTSAGATTGKAIAMAIVFG